MKYLTMLVLALVMSVSLADDLPPRLTNGRVILSTDFGDLVLALYPDVAPAHVRQILKLVRVGAYDGTHIFRVMPNFVVQVSEVRNRLTPLKPEQRAVVKPIKAEFSKTLSHEKGVLSMARWEDPDSATSSFSILLNKAPHLDGKYTIFGRLESGGSVINRILAVPRDNETPRQRITIDRAYIVEDMATYYKIKPFDSIDHIGEAVPQSGTRTAVNPGTERLLQLVLIIVAAMIAVSLSGFFLYDRISKKRMLSLLLVNVLLCGFILFIAMIPVGHQNTWIAALVFLGLFAMFRLMSQFESKR